MERRGTDGRQGAGRFERGLTLAVVLLVAAAGLLALLGAPALTTSRPHLSTPVGAGPAAGTSIAGVPAAVHVGTPLAAGSHPASSNSSNCPSNASYASSIDGVGYCFTLTENPNGSYTYCVYGGIWNWQVPGNASVGSSAPSNLTCYVLENSFFGLSCAPFPGVNVGAFGLNFTFLSTPANGTGPAPLNFSWNASVSGGGLPPYRVVVFLEDENFSYLSTNLTGNVTLTGIGLYTVTAIAEDSSCTQSASVTFPLQVYGALGPSPVSIAATLSSATVPSNATFTVNTTNLPANWTISWATPGIFASPGAGLAAVENYTYFLPGNYSATACYVTPSGVTYACGVSPTVTVGGASPLQTSVSIAPGPYPTNVTYAASLVPGTWLPSGTELYLFADTDAGYGVWNVTNGTTVSLTVPESCGFPYTPYIPPAGNCSYPAIASLHGPYGGLDAGYLGETSIDASLVGNGSIASWFPTLSVTDGPTNGTLPLNVSLNLSAANGVAPYDWSYSAIGRTSGAANASFLPEITNEGFAWNGSTLSETLTLNHTGVYWVQVFLSDSEDHWTADSLPLIVLGNVSPLAPLQVRPGLQIPSLANGGSAEFEVAIQGGEPPYAIQWTFGDGTFASSEPGQTIAHTYAPGRYAPSVTVTDRAGSSVTRTLPEVVVAATPGERTTGLSSSPATFSLAWVPVLAAAAGAAGLLLLGVRAVRRESRRQGEILIDEATDLAGRAPPP